MCVCAYLSNERKNYYIIFFLLKCRLYMLIINFLLDVEIERVCGGLSGGPGGARRPPCRGQCRAPELSAEHAPGSSDQLLPLPPRAAHPLLQE